MYIFRFLPRKLDINIAALFFKYILKLIRAENALDALKKVS